MQTFAPNWTPHPCNILLYPVAEKPDFDQSKVTSCFTGLFSRQNGKNWLTLTNHSKRGMQIPGGHREKGEDPKTTAKRELWEETGIIVSEDQLVLFAVGVVLAPNAAPDSKYGKESFMLYYGLLEDSPYVSLSKPIDTCTHGQMVEWPSGCPNTVPAWDKAALDQIAQSYAFNA